jgi:hypothetical protein
MHLRSTAVLGVVRSGFSFWVDSSTAKLGEMLGMRDEDESSRYAGVEGGAEERDKVFKLPSTRYRSCLRG